jgi:CRISPR-associated endonuclease/helicase Cas3
MGFRPDREVGSMARRAQKGFGGVPAPTRFLVDFEITHPGVVASVEVVGPGHARLDRRFGERFQHVPAQALLFNPPFTAAAMKRLELGRSVTARVHAVVVFVGFEVLQRVRPVPFRLARCGGPAVVVARLTSHVDHAVDAGTTTQRFAARVAQAAAIEARIRLGLVEPVGAGIADAIEVTHRDVDPRVVIPDLNYKTFTIDDPTWNKAVQSGIKESSKIGFRLNAERKQFHLALKAGLIVADSASSGLVREKHSIEEWISNVIHSDEIKDNDIFTEIIQKRMNDKNIPELHEFQKQVATKGNRVLLMAGCGMGKTLAAWNWANDVSKRQKISKVIFLYPTRGTATEGFKDYASWAPETDAALMHGTSKYELDSMFKNPDDDKSKANYIPEDQERLFALAFWSKKFFSATADQFLSFLQNNYKGICLLPVLSECALIVDEVHSFDKAMFASLLSFLEHFDLPILCMTATLTPKNKQSLLDLGLKLYPEKEDRIQLDKLEEQENHPRYNKTILENSEQAREIAIKSFREGKRVLWVLNTVARCQEMYETLTNELNTEVHCYHSRFKLSDRKDIHEKTVKAFQGNSKNSIAVTTQVCEMSLDLDADVLISEYAPVSSMVQRFGRANRHLKNGEDFRAELYLYKVSGCIKPYLPSEITVAENFLKNLPDKDISQSLLATKLEEYSNQEYKTLPSACFVDSGYFALPCDYRDIEEFTVQAVLDENFPEIKKLLEFKKSIDGYILPVPQKKELNLRSEEHSLLPKFLWVVSKKYYNEKRGFAI